MACIDHSGANVTTAATFATTVKAKLTAIAAADNTFRAAVANCAYGLISLAYTITNGGTWDATYDNTSTYGTDAKVALVCRACKPGYRPTYTAMPGGANAYDVGVAVHSCTAISNCDTTTVT